MTPRPPFTRIQCWSAKLTFSGGSLTRDAMSCGRSPSSSVCSATRAARFAERTAAKVAKASTSVPPAVAREEIVAQSAMLPTLWQRACAVEVRRLVEVLVIAVEDRRRRRGGRRHDPRPVGRARPAVALFALEVLQEAD